MQDYLLNATQILLKASKGDPVAYLTAYDSCLWAIATASRDGTGLTSREYLTFMLATTQAIYGSVIVQMNGEQALNDFPAGVLKDNVHFFIANQAAFEALEK